MSRKLFLFGRYSLALLLPKKWLTELGVKRGESVEMELDRRRGRVVLRFNQTKPTVPAKVVSPTKLKDTDPSTDLQPIPEL